MKKILLSICLGLFFAGSCFSTTPTINSKDTSIFLGTIGPLFVVQTGINLQLTYQYNLLWSLDLEWGQYKTGSISPFVETTYSSIGSSFFLKEIPFVKRYLNITSPSFVRTSYSYHDDKQFSRPNQIIGRKISNGIEVSAGVRATRSWYTLEIIPLSFYFPLSSKASGKSMGSIILDRVLSLKIGITY